MKKYLFVFLIVFVSCSCVYAESSTYYELDFSDGSFGGGYVPVYVGDIFMQPTSPEIVYDSKLDGVAVEFSTHDQMRWESNSTPSNYHYIAFDFFATSEDSIVLFLDTPVIKRTDIAVQGRHKFEVYYDLLKQESVILLDGKEHTDFEIINFWDQSPPKSSVRITHSKSAWMSGESFQVDNFIWKVGVIYTPENIPLSAIMSLLL